MQKPDDVPQDVWDAAVDAMAGVGWYATSMIIGAARGIMAENKRCAALIEGGFDRPVAERYRNDGVASKNDKCPHGKYMYEDCEPCCVVAIRGVADV